MLGHCAGEDILVFTAWRVSPDPGDIMTFLSQRDNGVTGHVFIGEEFHDTACSGKTFSA